MLPPCVAYNLFFVGRWFITSIVGPGGEDVPSGNFHPLEEQSRKEASGGNFQGGSGLVQVVRYTEGPIGELSSFSIRQALDLTDSFRAL